MIKGNKNEIYLKNLKFFAEFKENNTFLRPSEIYYTKRCPIYNKIDDVERDYSSIGRKNHDLVKGLFYKCYKENSTDSLEKEDVFLAKYVKDILKVAKKASCFGVETPVFTNIGTDLIKGTPDFFAIIDKTLYIVDLKAGRGKFPIYAEEQLKAYAFLLIDHLELDNIAQIKAVIYHRKEIKSILLTLKDIVKFKEQIRKKAVLKLTEIKDTSIPFPTLTNTCDRCYKISRCLRGIEYLRTNAESLDPIFYGSPQITEENTKNYNEIKKFSYKSKDFLKDYENLYKEMFLSAGCYEDFLALSKIHLEIKLRDTKKEGKTQRSLVLSYGLEPDKQNEPTQMDIEALKELQQKYYLVNPRPEKGGENGS